MSRAIALLRRVPRPSPALLIGLLALVVATTGTAVAATGTAVNIADPTNASQLAKVDVNGKLLVGDGAGPFDVAARTALPADALHGSTEFAGTTACQRIYTLPAGKAAVLTSMRLAAYTATSNAGSAASVRLYINSPSDTNCGTGSGGALALMEAAGPGTTELTFDPGLNVPAGYTVNANQYLPTGTTGMHAVASVDGYRVASTAVPASSAAVAGSASSKGAALR
jgi:hypothetical protein